MHLLSLLPLLAISVLVSRAARIPSAPAGLTLHGDLGVDDSPPLIRLEAHDPSPARTRDVDKKPEEGGADLTSMLPSGPYVASRSDALTAGAADGLSAGAVDVLSAGAVDVLSAGAVDVLSAGAVDVLSASGGNASQMGTSLETLIDRNDSQITIPEMSKELMSNIVSDPNGPAVAHVLPSVQPGDVAEPQDENKLPNPLGSTDTAASGSTEHLFSKTEFLTSTLGQNAIVPPDLIITSTAGTNEVSNTLPRSPLVPKYSSTHHKRGSLLKNTNTTQHSVSAVRPLNSGGPLLKTDSHKVTSLNKTRNSFSIEDKWRDLEKTFRLYTGSVMKRILPKILRIHAQLNISSQCNAALLQLITGLRGMKSWAVKMVDSSGRLPSGSLGGTLTDLGDYDQCLDIDHQSTKHRSTHGQYCTLELKPTLPALGDSVTLNTRVLDFGDASRDTVLSDLSHGSALFHFMVMRIGVCVPSSCAEDDIKELAKAVLRKVPVQVSVRNCEVKEGFRLTIPQFIVIATAIIIGMFIIIGTFMESYVSRNATKPQEIGRVPQSLVAFSVTTNLRRLLKSSRRNSQLSAVNGVRCLSLMWIVLAHTYGFGHRQGLARLSHARTYMDDVFFQIITNAWVSVDTFFLLGGLLVATSNLKLMEKTNGKINFVSHVLHRIWRLTPPLAATLGAMFLLPLIGSGPLWADMVGQKVSHCETSWWQVFLPINTWVDFSTMCLLHTWYIASDMHFYCAAPFLLMLLYRWPGAGLALIFTATAACSLATGLITIFNNLPPTVIFFSPDIALTKRTANLIYFRPYPHFGAYCVGLLLGYILWKYRKFSFSKLTQGLGWCVSIGSCLAVLLATYPWNRGQSADPAESCAYAVLHRTVWAAGVGWVLFMCATGYGNLVNKFLGWKVFQPLSRLCYSVYLLHFPVLWVRVSWRRTLLNFHHYDIVTEFLGILMITLGLSVLFHLMFEAPFLKLEDIWFPERRIVEKPSKASTDVKHVT